MRVSLITTYCFCPYPVAAIDGLLEGRVGKDIAAVVIFKPLRTHISLEETCLPNYFTHLLGINIFKYKLYN